MTREEFEYLKSEPARVLLHQYRNADAQDVALRLRNAPLATLIKTLGRCRRKLSTFSDRGCIVIPRSYEQSSSQAAAFAKRWGSGRLAIDLTCGLGVDAWAMSCCYERVVAVERDEIRADIARYNFELLGADNIEVVCGSAEDFLLPGRTRGGVTDTTHEVSHDETIGIVDMSQVDLVYVDPSREQEDGRRVYSLEQSSPNILTLLPALQRAGVRRVMVKLSPLYDVQQAARDFPGAQIEVVSVDGECKEVLILVDNANVHNSDSDNSELVCTTVKGEILGAEAVIHRHHFMLSDIGRVAVSEASTMQYLHLPDVVFYKCRTVGAYADTLRGAVVAGGYVFADHPIDGFMGQVYKVLHVHDYQPKKLVRMMREMGVKRANIHLREFPYSAASVQKSLALELGGKCEIFFTTINGANKVFFVSLHPTI